MKTEDRLRKVFSLLLAAVRKDEKLAAEIDALLGFEKRPPGASVPSGSRHRRKPAVFDPFEVYEQGESTLRSRLGELDLEALKDIVAEHGMDPGKLVLKWKTKERILEHILVTVQARSKRGDAFRS
jgi:hypothetical protein